MLHAPEETAQNGLARPPALSHIFLAEKGFRRQQNSHFFARPVQNLSFP
jgi:hypothetical protein